MRFDRQKFFGNFRQWRGSVTQQQFKGLTFLLDCIESDRFITRISWASYMLATTMHETAFTFMPIHEYGGKSYFINRYGSQTRIGKKLGNDTPEEGADYAGQGYVQTTGESNYEASEDALRREYPALIADFERETGKRFDLTVGDQPNDKDDPKNAMHPKIAYAIMSYGMRSGMFTSKTLSNYLNERETDYVGARRIINGTDKAATIAGYAKSFEAILKVSLIKSNPVPAIVQTESEPILDLPDENAPTGVQGAGNEQSNNAHSAQIEQGSTKTNIEVDGNKINVNSESDNTPPEKVAVVKPPNFFEYIKTEIAGFFGGNVSIDAATEKAGQVQALGLPYSFWSKVIYFAIAATIIYFVVKLVRLHQANKKTEVLVKANTTANNTVILVDEKDIAAKQAEGFKIITR